MVTTLLLLAVVAGPTPARPTQIAASRAADDSVVAGVHWTIHSAALGEDREISVHLPAAYGADTSRFAVLYVLDGEQLFLPLTGVAETLSWAHRAPPLIVVAVHNTNRTRDLTTPWSGPAPVGSYRSAAARAGGADRFLEFLRTELIPAVDRRYRTASFRVLFGHSLGGLFALHVFARAPGLFSATIASSPPAFWNGDEEIRRIAAGFASGAISGGHLFVTAAAKEFDDTPRAVAKLGELLRLRAPGSVDWSARTIPAADHGTALLAAAQGGLELAFVGWRLPSFVFDEGLDSVESYYSQRSAEYGFRVDVPEGEIAALASRLQAAHDAAALRVYERYAELYPTSVSARAGLGEALALAGDVAAARAAYARAIALADASHDERLEAIRQQRDSLLRQSSSPRR